MAEILIGVWQTAAFQPLGHLTATESLRTNDIRTYANAPVPSIVPKNCPCRQAGATASAPRGRTFSRLREVIVDEDIDDSRRVFERTGGRVTVVVGRQELLS